VGVDAPRSTSGETVPRKPFDTSCDLIYGPNGLVPNTVYATGSCRVVPLITETPFVPPLSQQTAYITLDFAIPNGPRVTGSDPVWTYDYSYADVIAVPAGNIVSYQVIEVQRVLYRSHAVYYRAYVRPVGSSPPISGCFGCALSPSLWRVSWMGAGFAVPFNGPSFVVGFQTGTAPGCEWAYNFGAGNQALLIYRAGLAPVLRVTVAFVLSALYYVAGNPASPPGAWHCNAVNVLTQDPAFFNPTFPTDVSLSPI
jgi:hypothetical protein